MQQTYLSTSALVCTLPRFDSLQSLTVLTFIGAMYAPALSNSLNLLTPPSVGAGGRQRLPNAPARDELDKKIKREGDFNVCMISLFSVTLSRRGNLLNDGTRVHANGPSTGHKLIWTAAILFQAD